MSINSQANYYLNNSKYTTFLESHHPDEYQKYTDFIQKYALSIKSKKISFLDVGSGTGQALQLLSKNKRLLPQGIEISKTSVKQANKKGLLTQLYDGDTIPFKDQTFDIVGSFNVLEHTQDPLKFLEEKLRVLKQNGFLIIVCPNFLSVTNNYHYHTRGINQKLKNLFSLASISISGNTQFAQMLTVNRIDFQPDDDALNATNPITLINWSKEHNLQLIFHSSQQRKIVNPLIDLLDQTWFKYLLGSCFFIFKKVGNNQKIKT